VTYDPKSEPQEFIANTRGEAVAKACSFFGANEGELHLVELDPKEVAGITGCVVVVAAPSRARREQRPPPRPERPERPDRPERRGRPAPAELPVQEEAAPEDEEESVGTARTSLGTLGEFVKGIVERMDLGPFEISESEEGELILVVLTGPAANRLRSGDGRGADAIQLLANQAAMRAGEKGRRVVVDVEGDPGQREAFLERMAQRAARRALDSGRSVALEPMNPRDRRVIHVALRDTGEIVTMSIGQGRYRQVVVVPEGAPEYEEARRYEAEATQAEE
jgi:spoIIIJ-associated protein